MVEKVMSLQELKGIVFERTTIAFFGALWCKQIDKYLMILCK